MLNKIIFAVGTFVTLTASLPVDPFVQDLVSKMTNEEKFSLLGGVSGDYVGNIQGISRLNITTINMNDGPQGFRTIGSGTPGTTTQWPCGLNIASSWDTEFAKEFGSAMGEEFRGKGANVQLGPGVCIARVPRNGRNFEYLSGEDPFLGATLVAPVVSGIQSQGVIANAKHFVNNNQETNRTGVSATVPARAQWEIYYAPFKGAVDAGVLSIMCSYNKINGTYSCENSETLGDLKSRMGFNGWVMSDWGATHSLVQAANAGLDQEMGNFNFWQPTKMADAVEANLISMKTIDEKIIRILTSMKTIGLFDNKFKYGTVKDNVTSPEHNQLARKLATTVLLKNDNDFLPLSDTKKLTIAVVGDAASNSIITGGGGSGSVVPAYQISPLAGIKAAGSSSNTVNYYPSTNITDQQVNEALQADVIIYSAATTSSEGSDRSSLSLPNGDDALIARIAEKGGDKMVVSMVTPGAILMPWSDSVEAITLQFMPGQEEGNALADVLFGKISPSGKLPLTMPNKENEVQFTDEMYPGLPADKPANETYSEELLVGYRWYHEKNVKPKYAFGHGLTFASFALHDFDVYGTADSGVSACTRVSRTDNFKFDDASEIIQLYVDYPASANEPPRVLKGFQKITLKKGESKKVCLVVSKQDLSIFDVTANDWAFVKGTYSFHIGTSSDNLRLSGVKTL